MESPHEEKSVTRKADSGFLVGQISEQTLEQILDDIEAQEELNGTGKSLEAELAEVTGEAQAQHSINDRPGSIGEFSEQKAKILRNKRPIKLDRKSWAKLNGARIQRYASIDEGDIPEIDFFAIAEYNKLNEGYVYVIRNYGKESFAPLSKYRIIPQAKELYRKGNASNGQSRINGQVSPNSEGEGSVGGSNGGRSEYSANGGKLSENAGYIATNRDSFEDSPTGRSNADSGYINSLEENSSAQHSISPIVGQQAEYGVGVVLDTTLFEGVNPRDWGRVLGDFVYNHLAGAELMVYDDAGNAETIHLARTTDRVRKDGARNSHKVIDKIARYRGDNIKALATVHLSELLQTSKQENTTDEHNHQWLDENGWEYRKTYLQDAQGNIYEATLNIALGRDRNILYDINNVRRIDVAKEERVAHGVVPSTDSGRGSHIKSNSSGEIVSENSPGVKERHSVSAPADRQAIIRDLKSILNRGGDPAELRRYVTSLEQNVPDAEQSAGAGESESTAAEQIVQAAHGQNISVEQYLEQNWEQYEVDGQWSTIAREALDLESQGRKYSVSSPAATLAYDYSKTFAEQVDDYKNGRIPKGDTLIVGPTPEVFQKIGFNALPMSINTTHVDYALYGTKDADHYLGEAKLKQLPDSIKKPIAVFVSKTQPSTSVVALLPFQVNGKQVVAPVVIDGFGFQNGVQIDSNAISSVFGKTNAISKLLLDAITDEQSGTFSLLYINKKEANTLLQVARLQLPGGLKYDGFINSIRDARSPVKPKFNDVTETQQFRRWFGNSKVVNADGTPKVVYYGSKELFTVFSYGHIGAATGAGILGDGFYFTDKKTLAEQYGENVYGVYLRMTKPYVAGESDAYRLNVAKLQKQGYDGVILNAPTGTVYMVFENTQIKSATDNIGTFDGNNPDIQHSVGEAPSQESVSVENTGEQISADDETDDVRSVLPKKARDYLKRTERQLLNGFGRSLGVPWHARKEYLQPIIEEISNEYLRSGTVSQDTIDRLFDTAYDEGIVVDREFYDQYKEIKDYLRTTDVTLSESNKEDIADFADFRKRNYGTLRIVNQGGLPVDTAYEELRDMAPELFPEDITHPADQLVQMADIGKSIKIAEYSLDYYYGNNAENFRKQARNDFESAINDVLSELQKVKRYHEDRQAGDAALAPTTPEEAMEAYSQLKAARRTYEKAAAKNLLTQHDEMQLGRLLRGEIEVQHLDPEEDNIQGIAAVYEAKAEYAQILKLLTEYKKSLRAQQRNVADSYLETANTWEDKKAGIAYSRETMPRNVEDIVPDRKLAKAINTEYFEPVAVAEAKATRFKDEYRDKVRELQLSTKPANGDLVSEAHAVQLLGEAQDNIRILEKSRGRIRQRDGKHLSEWREVINKLWEENPSLDKGKIQSAVDSFRSIYDELFRQMNEVRVRNGYEPVNYRSGYFPHFQPGDGDGVLAQFGRLMGINTQIEALPTTINGLTHTFKPGIQWFGNAQERLGFNTAYDAVEGFDKYIEGVASVIFHTDNIQKLRALATQIRYRTSEDGIRKQVDEVYADSRLSEEEKQAQIAYIFEHGKYTLSNFVNELDEYTNLLANKKSKLDRQIESLFDRRFCTFLKAWERQVGANMIAGNLASALTNFIPLTQAGAQIDRFSLLQGMWGTLKAYRSGDGLVERSDFLTNRRGSDPLVKTWVQKGSAVFGKPMEFIDCFVSDSIVRGAYYQNLKRGLSAEDALHQADLFAARVMADRSKGAMPTLFSSVNPLFKAFTQFQLEVNNQFSEVFKDLPRSYRDKGIAALAGVMLKYFLGAWLFNELYEFFVGRRPALDPIDMLNEVVGDLTGYEMPNLLELGIDLATGETPSFEAEKEGFGGAVKNLAGNVLEELPFSSGLALLGADIDGGRIPAASAVPDLSAIWEALTNTEWSPEKRWKEAQDELNKLAYVLPPFGGNQISKIWKSAKAYFQGGSYSVDSKGNDILQYPVYQDDFAGLVRAMIMGKSALPQAQEWVEKGFNSFSAVQTAVYQDMIDADVDARDSYELLRKMEIAGKDDQKRSVLRESDISGDGKAIVYYGILASEKERALMDQLTDLGADCGEVADALMKIRDAAALAGSDETEEKRRAIIDAALTDEEKTVLVGDMLGTELETESGQPSQYAKFLTALDTGMDVDTYLQFRNEGGNVDKYLQLTNAGVSADSARDLALELCSLKPAEGDDRVRSVQEWRAVIDSTKNAAEQISALSTVMSESQHEKVQTAYSFGISPEVYVQLAEIKPQFDADGNGSYTQAEVEAAIDAMDAGWLDNPLLALSGQATVLTTEQKAILWQIVTGAKSAKNNPYSVAAGQRVLNSKETPGDTGMLSWSEELMRQLTSK